MDSHFAYTDGACSGNPGIGGWAALADGKMVSGWFEHTTNNAMELFAIFRAVEELPCDADIMIYTDSKLAIGWLKLGWKCQHDHLRAIIDSYWATTSSKHQRVSFTLVKGHSGNELNHKVDREAVLQCKIGKNALIARQMVSV